MPQSSPRFSLPTTQAVDPVPLPKPPDRTYSRSSDRRPRRRADLGPRASRLSGIFDAQANLEPRHRGRDASSKNLSGRLPLESYRRPHPFARGQALSESQLAVHRTSEGVSLAPVQGDDAHEQTRESHSPVPTDLYAPHGRFTSISAECPFREDIQIHQPEPVYYGTHCSVSFPGGWTYEWGSNTAQPDQGFLAQETWAHWFPPGQLLGYHWVLCDGSPGDNLYQTAQGQGSILQAWEDIPWGEMYDTLPQNAGMAGPAFVFPPSSFEPEFPRGRDVLPWGVAREHRPDTPYPTSQSSNPPPETEVPSRKIQAREVDHDRKVREGPFRRQKMRSGEPREKPADKFTIPHQPPRPGSSPGPPSFSPLSKQLIRLFCRERASQARSARRRAAVSAPPADTDTKTSGSVTPSSTPGERQLRELRELRGMRLLPNRPGRRRRARISSEYYSSSGVYTPLYPSPIEYYYTPSSVAGLGGNRGRSKSDVPHSEARRGLSGVGRAGRSPGDEEKLPDGEGRAQGPHHYGYATGVGSGETGQRWRRRRRRSQSKLTEIFPINDDAGSESLEDRGVSEGATTPVGREVSSSREMMVGRRILRRNSTGTMRVMDMESLGGASERSGS